MLPVESIFPELSEQIKAHNILLVAPPGAGKSTFLPLQLLKHPSFLGQKIIMLQPRRVAARAIAEYLAEQLNESVGRTVGYRMRGEQKVGKQTRLEVVTEGLLTRKLQQDPELTGVGLVIFDEFHERSIHADFSLALSIETQQALREDLRLVVMSATLDAEPLSDILPNAKLLKSEGRAHPIDIRYLNPIDQDSIATLVQLLLQVLSDHQGNVLVFLPGAFEIKAVFEQVRTKLAGNVKLYPLFGQQDKQTQKLALAPTAADERKIVLATNIAETSLTIDGISVVIDSGLEKVARFHLRKHITQLKVQAISQASSIQRAGRAGRLGPGICYRLWSAEKQQRLAKQGQAQILLEDIAPLVLQALAWGSPIDQLALLDKPSEAQMQQALDLLHALQALKTKNELTSHGRAMANLPCHPRVAHMLLHSEQLGKNEQLLACLLAAVLENSSALPHKNQLDLFDQITHLLLQPSHPVMRQAELWAKRINLNWHIGQIEQSLADLPILVGLAYPDFLAKQRAPGSYQMSAAGGAFLPQHQALSAEPWLAVADLLLTDKADARITLAVPISLTQIQQHFAHLISTKKSCQWHQAESRILSERVTAVGDISIEKQSMAKADPEIIGAVWKQVLQNNSLSILGWDEASYQLQNRIALANKLIGGALPAADERSLLEQVDAWLLPFIGDKTRLQELVRLDLTQLLLNRMDWNQQQRLEHLCPQKLRIPSGRASTLTYQSDGQVYLQVRMQEMYGLSHSPTIAQGKQAVIIEFLSPAGRPIQTTSDLAGFWQGSYKEVQKEMKGRYPKHFWPDNPADAQATTKTKKYM